jgi:iron complex outermembrane recepter protein
MAKDCRFPTSSFRTPTYGRDESAKKEAKSVPEHINTAFGEFAMFKTVMTRSALIAVACSLPAYAVADAAAESETELEEVVVNAQKRLERVQDVPISISVLSGQELDGSTSQGIMEALTHVPGVGMFQGFQTGGPLISVRGVNAINNISSGSNPIAYYLDTVPFSFVRSAITPDASAYDLERVEVLRGPQGTLYGATAQNGVVRVLTQDADLDRMQFKMRTSGSSTQDGGESYRVDAAANLPIVKEKLGARFVVGYQNLSGWVDKPNDEDANDAEILNLRLKLNARPSDELSIGLTAWVSRSDYGAPSTGLDGRTHRSWVTEPIASDYELFGLKATYDFAHFSLTSASGYIDYRVDSRMDTVMTAAGTNVLTTNLVNRLFSQEVYLNSTHGGPWRWTIGGMYRDAEDGYWQLRQNLFTGLPTGGYVQPGEVSFRSKSNAVFGELTRLLAEGRFELTAGLRYFEDEVDQREALRFNSLSAPLLNSDDRFSSTSPRLVLTWHPNDETTVYTSYAEGFRSGAAQLPSVTSIRPDFPPARPDSLKNYEIGAKGNLFENRLAYDAAVYYMDWQDVQQTLSVVYQSASLPALVNGVSASGAGFDLGLTVRPIAALTLGLNFSMNDLAQDTDVIIQPTTTNSVALYHKGERLTYSPEYTVGGNASYAFPIAGGYDGEVSLYANYISERSVNYLPSNTATASARSPGDPMTTVDARFTFASPYNWEASLFADNLTDEDGAVMRHPGNPEWTSRIRPRTIGLQFDYRF